MSNENDLTITSVENILKTTGLSLNGEPITRGAVAMVYPAIDKSQNLPREVAIRIPKFGTGKEIREEIANRTLAQKSASPDVINHIPQLLEVGNNPVFLVVDWIDGRPLPTAIHTMSIEDTLNLSKEMVRYASGWHELGKTLNDIDSAPHDPLSKCDRFIVNDTGAAITWSDADANTMGNLDDDNTIREIIHKEAENIAFYRRYVELATLVSSPQCKAFIEQFNNAQYSPNPERLIASQLRKKAGSAAFSNRTVVQRVLGLPANDDQVRQESTVLAPNIRQEVLEKQSKTISELAKSLNIFKASIMKNVKPEIIAKIASSKLTDQEIYELQTDSESIPALCRLLTVDDGDLESTLISMLGEGNIMSISPLRSTQLIPKRARLKSILDVMCGPLKIEQPQFNIGTDPIRDMRVLLSTIDSLPNLVVQQRTGSLIRADYTKLMAIISHLIGISGRRDIQYVTHLKTRFSDVIESQQSDTNINRNIGFELTQIIEEVGHQLTG